MAKEGVYTPFNKNIDNLILANPTIHANKLWLFQQIADYVADLDLLSTGVEYKELGLAEKRAKQKPTSIIISSNGVISNGLFDQDVQSDQLAIAHLKLRGVMRLESGLSTRGVRSLINDIREVNNAGTFSAILLETNSGGGESIAGQELKNAIVDSVVPVYTFGQLIASAALHATLPSNQIILSGNSSEMGSIGSMVTIDQEFIKFFKKNFKEIYSAESPKKNQEFRQLLKGKTDLLLDYVTANDKLFMQEVEKFRNLTEATKSDTLQGAMFFAEEAVERGLADNIATFEQTVQAIIVDVSNNDNNNSSFKFKSKKMNISILSDTWNSIISNYNRITGKQVAENAKPEDVLTDMKTVQSLPDFKNSVIAEATAAINSQVQGLTDTVTSLTNKITELEEANTTKANSDSDLATKVENLTNDVSNLTDKNTELTATNKDLVNQIAEISGKPAEGGGAPAAKRTDTASTFSKKLGEVTISNEAKYSSSK